MIEGQTGGGRRGGGEKRERSDERELKPLSLQFRRTPPLRCAPLAPVGTHTHTHTCVPSRLAPRCRRRRPRRRRGGRQPSRPRCRRAPTHTPCPRRTRRGPTLTFRRCGNGRELAVLGRRSKEQTERQRVSFCSPGPPPCLRALVFSEWGEEDVTTCAWTCGQQEGLCGGRGGGRETSEGDTTALTRPPPHTTHPQEWLTPQPSRRPDTQPEFERLDPGACAVCVWRGGAGADNTRRTRSHPSFLPTNSTPPTQAARRPRAPRRRRRV